MSHRISIPGTKRTLLGGQVKIEYHDWNSLVTDIRYTSDRIEFLEKLLLAIRDDRTGKYSIGDEVQLKATPISGVIVDMGNKDRVKIEYYSHERNQIESIWRPIECLEAITNKDN